MIQARALSLCLSLALVACAPSPERPVANDSASTPPKAETADAAAAPDPVAAIRAAVEGAWRSAEDRSRDAWRHPVESLAFWGLAPGMQILEVQPGGGWWTEILAPYARATGGQFYATGADLADPKVDEAARKSREKYAQRFAAKPDIYGEIKLLDFGPNSAPLPPAQFDFILTARSFHGWIRRDMVDKVLKDFHGALKLGGILAVEQHRANPGQQELPPDSGYVTEAYLIERVQKAGFELVARSEINANPKDSKDHPFGVWTLPPASRTRPYAEGPDAVDPTFDRSKYDAIGESDRMTLRFRKPA